MLCEFIFAGIGAYAANYKSTGGGKLAWIVLEIQREAAALCVYTRQQWKITVALDDTVVTVYIVYMYMPYSGYFSWGAVFHDGENICHVCTCAVQARTCVVQINKFRNTFIYAYAKIYHRGSSFWTLHGLEVGSWDSQAGVRNCIHVPVIPCKCMCTCIFAADEVLQLAGLSTAGDVHVLHHVLLHLPLCRVRWSHWLVRQK